MIKAVVYVDNRIDNNYSYLKCLYGLATAFVFADAGEGYSACLSKVNEFIISGADVAIITNSLEIYNDGRLKELVSTSATYSRLLTNYYLVDKKGVLRPLQSLTDCELHTYHNLEKMYINKAFEKLEELEKC